ncbi:hypothetical protein ACS0TY_014263 [Phlomoides rotata]
MRSKITQSQGIALCHPLSSTSGRVLDVFRSSLTPKIVEVLICSQDWIRGSRHHICIEEQLEELEHFEKDLPNIGNGGGLSSTTNN